jgi:hypothetical protein
VEKSDWIRIHDSHCTWRKHYRTPPLCSADELRDGLPYSAGIATLSASSTFLPVPLTTPAPRLGLPTLDRSNAHRISKSSDIGEFGNIGDCGCILGLLLRFLS